MASTMPLACVSLVMTERPSRPSFGKCYCSLLVTGTVFLRGMSVRGRVWLQAVVTAVVKVLPGIGNVMMLVSIFWLCFCILGMSLFKGKLHHCVCLDAEAPCDMLNRDACLDVGYSWENQELWSFDSKFCGPLELVSTMGPLVPMLSII